MITIVAGFTGAGKTTWIRQQLAQIQEPVLYFSAGCGNLPIDAAVLDSELPQVKAMGDDSKSAFLQQVAAGRSAYVEVGFHLEFTSVTEWLQSFSCHRVAIVPPESLSPRQPSELNHLSDWADEQVPGVPVAMTSPSSTQVQIQRSVLTGQVIDPASLEMFWYELTQGAYGMVYRAKGIFDVVDGRSFHFNFIQQSEAPDPSETEYTELNLPRWLNGRPDRFSGIEIVGKALDQNAIGQTLEDCCLTDQLIAYYQAQVRESLEMQTISD
jgi:G3E family GTPase